MRRELYERDGKGESRLKFVLKNHPYSALFMLFILIFGFATGASTSLIFGDCGIFSRVRDGFIGGAQVSVTAVALRTLLFNFSLAAFISASAYYAAFYPFSCLSVASKGFCMGVGFGACAAELGASGAVYGGVCVILPTIVTLTGMLIMFIAASSRLAAGALMSAVNAPREAGETRGTGGVLPGGRKAVPLGLMLVLIGSLFEAGLQTLFTLIFPW